MRKNNQGCCKKCKESLEIADCCHNIGLVGCGGMKKDIGLCCSVTIWYYVGLRIDVRGRSGTVGSRKIKNGLSHRVAGQWPADQICNQGTCKKSSFSPS